jgi:hypothetical protein
MEAADDYDLRLFEHVEDRIGKAAQEVATNRRLDDWTDQWVLREGFERGIKRSKEADPVRPGGGDTSGALR